MSVPENIAINTLLILALPEHFIKVHPYFVDALSLKVIEPKLLEGQATQLVTGQDPRRRLHLMGMGGRLIPRPVGDPPDKGKLLGGKHAPWLLAGG